MARIQQKKKLHSSPRWTPPSCCTGAARNMSVLFRSACLHITDSDVAVLPAARAGGTPCVRHVSELRIQREALLGVWQDRERPRTGKPVVAHGVKANVLQGVVAPGLETI